MRIDAPQDNNDAVRLMAHCELIRYEHRGHGGAVRVPRTPVDVSAVVTRAE